MERRSPGAGLSARRFSSIEGGRVHQSSLRAHAPAERPRLHSSVRRDWADVVFLIKVPGGGFTDREQCTSLLLTGCVGAMGAYCLSWNFNVEIQALEKKKKLFLKKKRI